MENLEIHRPHTSRRERAADQSAQALAANAARRQDWQRICDSYVATLTPPASYSTENAIPIYPYVSSTSQVPEFGDTSIPPFASDSLFPGLETQTSTPIIQPERTRFDYQTKNSHGLPGGMIGNFDRPPDVQARIEASNRAEVIGQAIDHPDMSGLSPEMRMAARINNAVRHIDQGIRNLSEGISQGVANISHGFSRAREAFSSLGQAKSPSHNPRSIADRRRMAIAAAVASGLMASCAGSIPVPPDQGPGQIQQVTPILPAKALGIIPVDTSASNAFKFPDLTVGGRPLFAKGMTTLRATSGTCTIAIPEDLQHRDRIDGFQPTALVIRNPIFDVLRNPLVNPNLGSQWYLRFPTLYFVSGEPKSIEPVLINPDLIDSGPYEVRCYDTAQQSNFTQQFQEITDCASTYGNPIVSERNRQPRLTCKAIDPLIRTPQDGSYVTYGTIVNGSGAVVSQMPQALPDARNATITPARPTATPARPPEQNIKINPKGPIYTVFDFKCNTGNGSVELGGKLDKAIVQRVVLDNDGSNELCITGPTKDGEPTGAVTYRRPQDGQFVLTGRLQYDGTSKCFRDSKTEICLGQGDNFVTTK